MNRAPFVISIALLLSLSSQAGAEASPSSATVDRYQIVTTRNDKGATVRRYYYQLGDKLRRRIEFGVTATHRKLLKTRAAHPDPVDSLGVAPRVQELSCGIDAHHGGGGTISIGCVHGWYWCNVTISGDDGISGDCGYDPPTPATPTPG